MGGWNGKRGKKRGEGGRKEGRLEGREKGKMPQAARVEDMVYCLLFSNK